MKALASITHDISTTALSADGRHEGTQMTRRHALSDAIAEAVRQAVYQKAVDSERTIECLIEPTCRDCDGNGRVLRKNAFAHPTQRGTRHYKRCPSCKGRSVGEPIAFTLRLSESVRLEAA